MKRAHKEDWQNGPRLCGAVDEMRKRRENWLNKVLPKNWFALLSKGERKEYLTLHPNSTYGK